MTLHLLTSYVEQTNGAHGQAYCLYHCSSIYPEWVVCLSKCLKVENMGIKPVFAIASLLNEWFTSTLDGMRLLFV